MAEFDAVVKEYNRMCDKLDKNCDKCPIRLAIYGTTCACDQFLLMFPKTAEAIIMKWAAENPEPIYSSWYDYLIGRGLIEHKNVQFYDVESGGAKHKIRNVAMLAPEAYNSMSERDGKMLGLKPINVSLDKDENV